MNFKYFFILPVLVLLGACCYKKYRLPSVDVYYFNSNITSGDLKAYYKYTGFEKWQQGNVKIYGKNPIRTMIYIEDVDSIALVLKDSTRVDVFSNISFKKVGRCKSTIKKISFLHNGVLHKGESIYFP